MKFLVLVIILAAIYGLFTIFGKRKRKTQDSTTNSESLKPGKVNRIFVIATGTVSKEKIKPALQNAGCRIIEADNGDLIAYSGKVEDAQLHGVVNMAPEKLPLRIVVSRQGNNLNVRMDEDYGFQMFMGAVKQKFNDNYEKGFDYYEAIIKQNV